MSKVIIIGAGISGISAGYYLAKNNIQTEIYEAKNKIGGRACSFLPKNTGEIIDNGQHLFISAYSHFFEILHDIGTYNKLYHQKKLYVPFSHNGKFYFLDASKLPDRVGLIHSLFSIPKTSITSKFSLIKLFSDLKSHKKIKNFIGKSALSFLQQYKQDKEIIKKFWEPLVVATMNCSLEQADAEIFINVLKEAFLRTNTTSALILPAEPLGNILAPFTKWFCKNSENKIFLNSPIKEMFIENNKISAIKLKSDISIAADCFISALPPANLLKILPDHLKNTPFFSNLNKIEHSCIISAYVWTKVPLFDYDLICVIDKNIQWIFNKNSYYKRLFENNLKTNTTINKSKNYLYSITISNANKLKEYSIPQLKELMSAELLEIFPDLSKNDILNLLIVKELKATMMVNPNSVKYRLNQETPVENLFICGDWTHTELPATIEGAAKSGFIASSKAISYLTGK